MSLNHATRVERRREQNRLAQRRFRQRHQPSSPEYHRRLSISSLTSAPHSGTPSNNNMLLSPEQTPSVIANGNCNGSTGLPGLAQDWELPWLEGNAIMDSMNFGMDPGRAGFQQTPDISTSPSEARDSRVIEHILEQFSSAEVDPSHVIDDNTHGIGDPESNCLLSPGVSPLHTAAKRGHANIVRLLLRHGADCNAQDEDGLTPLMHATIGDSEEVAGLLLPHGAGIQFVDHDNRSALHWAVIRRRERLLKMLLEYCKGNRAVVDAVTREGKTPLHIAVDTDFEAAVEVLLNSGADAQHKAPKSEPMIDDAMRN